MKICVRNAGESPNCSAMPFRLTGTFREYRLASSTRDTQAYSALAEIFIEIPTDSIHAAIVYQFDAVSCHCNPLSFVCIMSSMGQLPHRSGGPKPRFSFL